MEWKGAVSGSLLVREGQGKRGDGLALAGRAVALASTEEGLVHGHRVGTEEPTVRVALPAVAPDVHDFGASRVQRVSEGIVEAAVGGLFRLPPVGLGACPS